MEKHQSIAFLISILMSVLIYSRHGLSDQGIALILLVFILLIPILLYHWVSYFSGFGFPEVFARDHGSKNHPAPYAFFFWLIFIIVCASIIFEWSIY